MSSWSPLILIELVLVFGTVVGWGAWQLWDLRRERRKDERLLADAERREGQAASAASADAGDPRSP